MGAQELLTEDMLDIVIAALAERANGAIPEEEKARLRNLANSDELRERVKAIVAKHTRDV